MNRNFDRFEVGHWYVYTGTEVHSCFVRGQKFVLDHKANKCVKASNVYRADFDRGYSDTSLPFTWEGLGKNNCFDNWIEVEDPNNILRVNLDDFYYTSENNCIVKSKHNNMCLVTGHYKLSRPPYGETKVENKKEEFVPKKVKLSDSDDIWIECARPEELPCECYVAYHDNKLNIFAQIQNLIKVANINYGLPREYDGYLYAIPKARADEALKFVCNVKISDLKSGTKVKIKEDAVWMDKNGVSLFSKGGIYTVYDTDMYEWGCWNDNIPFKVKGGVSFKELDDSRFPIHWIEKIVDEKDIVLYRARLFDKAEQKIQSSFKIKITELKNKTDYAVYVKNNEERIKLMTAVGINWNNGDSFEKNKCTYPTHMIKRSYHKGMLWELSELAPVPAIYNMSDIDFEEDKVYIKGTNFYIGERVRVKERKYIVDKGNCFVGGMTNFCNKIVTINSNIPSISGNYNCEIKEYSGAWHTDWFEHIDEKKINGIKLSTKLIEEFKYMPNASLCDLMGKPCKKENKTKYIKLNKKPIKKVKEYKVHKQEYIALNKKWL